MKRFYEKYKRIIRLLKTAENVEQLEAAREEIAEVLPKVRIMFDYDQQNHTHRYDLWTHSLYVVINLPRNMDDDVLYLAALLHDIGKPSCQVFDTKDGKVNMHYPGHPQKSREIVANEVVPDLNKKGIYLTREQVRRLLYYVEYHDDQMSLRMKSIVRHAEMVPIGEFKNLMILQIADAKAHVLLPMVQKRIEVCTTLLGDYSDEAYARVRERK